MQCLSTFLYCSIYKLIRQSIHDANVLVLFFYTLNDTKRQKKSDEVVKDNGKQTKPNRFMRWDNYAPRSLTVCENCIYFSIRLLYTFHSSLHLTNYKMMKHTDDDSCMLNTTIYTRLILLSLWPFGHRNVCILKTVATEYYLLKKKHAHAHRI